MFAAEAIYAIELSLSGFSEGMSDYYKAYVRLLFRKAKENK